MVLTYRTHSQTHTEYMQKVLPIFLSIFPIEWEKHKVGNKFSGREKHNTSYQTIRSSVEAIRWLDFHCDVIRTISVHRYIWIVYVVQRKKRGKTHNAVFFVRCDAHLVRSYRFRCGYTTELIKKATDWASVYVEMWIAIRCDGLRCALSHVSLLYERNCGPMLCDSTRLFQSIYYHHFHFFPFHFDAFHSIVMVFLLSIVKSHTLAPAQANKYTARRAASQLRIWVCANISYKNVTVLSIHRPNPYTQYTASHTNGVYLLKANRHTIPHT